MGGADGTRMRGRRVVELSRHALRTPILAIRGTAELLLAGAGGPLGPTARELLAASGEAALCLERLVEPVMRLAEQAGAPPSPLEPIDLGAFLREGGVERVAVGRGAGPGASGVGRRGGRGALMVRARRARLGELLELAAGILGAPLEAELLLGRRSGAVLLRLAGGGLGRSGDEERPLLLGLAARSARLAGARLVVTEEALLGIVLAPAVRPSRGGATPPSGAAPGAARRRHREADLRRNAPSLPPSWRDA